MTVSQEEVLGALLGWAVRAAERREERMWNNIGFTFRSSTPRDAATGDTEAEVTGSEGAGEFTQ
ncbi:hypothetical protein ACFV6E_18200 [Streptomyces sp. NPDC059785]|uniref:hypothetical protein n=1 Tax=unclassified Streptomyces TaxID=2593676 RepID=UPI003653458C